ncbi:MAG: nucleotidyltransferase domain-containing protein [Clostridia bacterium]
MASQDVQALRLFIDRMRRENEVEADLAARLQREARAEALRLGAEMGKAEPDLRKVVLFGSALPGRDFRIDSDIDLAVVGGDRARLERLVASSSFPVDVIDLEEARPGIRKSIENEGILVYAAPEN